MLYLKLIAPLQVQTLIGAKNATAFDLTAACSGFVIALISAATYIRCGMYRNIVVIGADALSRYTDWRDRCKSNAAHIAVQRIPQLPCTHHCNQAQCIVMTVIYILLQHSSAHRQSYHIPSSTT